MTGAHGSTFVFHLLFLFVNYSILYVYTVSMSVKNKLCCIHLSSTRRESWRRGVWLCDTCGVCVMCGYVMFNVL